MFAVGYNSSTEFILRAKEPFQNRAKAFSS